VTGAGPGVGVAGVAGVAGAREAERVLIYCQLCLI
jgi:hypothetical protein